MTPIMRVLAGVALAAGLQGMTQTAQAAPKFAGTYIGMGWHLCQTKLVGHGNFPTVSYHDLDWTAGSNSAGMMSITISNLTFPGRPASSGQVTQTGGIEVLGHTMRDDNPPNFNSGIGRNVMSPGSFPFEVTDATLTAGDQVFDIVTTQGQRGIVTTMYMVRRPAQNDYCIDAFQMTKSDLTGFSSGMKGGDGDKDGDKDKDDDRH